jgi:hypothetical protein
MSTFPRYACPPEAPGLDIEASGATRFSWEYDDGRQRLLDLYQKGKDKQWDAAHRIDWSLDVDPSSPLGLPPEACPIYGSAMWDRLGAAGQVELGRHLGAWQFSQFLHGEQGALAVSARIVESVPDLDAKFYAATQTMDEARHVEIYSRFLQEKVGLLYPINPQLQALLADTLTDSRWDMPYLGMQVLIEGLALAIFGVYRDLAQAELPRQILAYVMQDEARHVAFGRLALRDYYRQLSSAERADREEFVVEGCYLMRDRLRNEEVYANLGLDVTECLRWTETSEVYRTFQSLLFTRIVPCVKDIGLWGPKVQRAYADMGVLDHAGADLEALMRDDEDVADRVEAAHAEQRARQAEVADVIAAGAGQPVD